MNDIHTEPLLTSWPMPLSGEDLRKCFGLKKKLLRHKPNNKTRDISLLPRLLSLF
jgi:hypothetical protein